MAKSVQVQFTIDGNNTGITLMPKTYSTGNTGFFAQLKTTDAEGNRYQTQVQMVKVKPATK